MLRVWREAAAEAGWMALCTDHGLPLHIFRLAGIYGPGRLPLKRLQDQLPLLKEEQSPFTNRIHAEDLADICLAAMERGVPGAAYNASDGHPSNMTDYFNRIADRAGLSSVPAGLWPAWSAPGVDAVVFMAGDAAMFGEQGLAALSVPVMAIGGTGRAVTGMGLWHPIVASR